MGHREKHFLWLVFCILVSSGANGQEPGSQITVGQNVQVSKDRSKVPHGEIWAGADHHDPNRLIACSMSDGEGQPTVYYVSNDHGFSWNLTLEVRDGLRQADPVCDFGPRGEAFAISLSVGGASRPSFPKAQTETGNQMLVYSSSNGGRSWQKEPVRLPFMDREGFASDDTSGRFHGRLYIRGTVVSATTLQGTESRHGVGLYRSLDGGRTFLGPVVRQSSSKFVLHGNNVVMSDGTVVATTGAITMSDSSNPKEKSSLMVVRSTDGGETLEPAITVNEDCHCGLIPTLSVDRSAAFKDRLYLVDVCIQKSRRHIILFYSSDKGKTWSSPRIIDDSSAAITPGIIDCDSDPVFNPVVAVNKNGVVGVAWYQNFCLPKRGWNLRFAASVDGGDTFTPSILISNRPQLFEQGEVWPVRGPITGSQGTRDGVAVGFSVNWGRFFFGFGETTGMAAGADGVFHAFWINNQTGVSQIWTAPIQVRGVGFANGSSELTSAKDVSEQILIRTSDVNFERATGILTSNVTLENRSSELLRAPLRIRLISMEGNGREVSVRGADNRIIGLGAVWDVPGEGLAPGEISHTVKIEIRLVEPQLFGPNGEEQGSLLKLVFRVLAGQ